MIHFLAVLKLFELAWHSALVCRYFSLHVLCLDTFISFVILITTCWALFCLLTKLYAKGIQRTLVCALTTRGLSCWWDSPFPPLSHTFTVVCRITLNTSD